MPLALPAAIAAYFAADMNDGGSVARCFTEQAVVTDEGRIHAGRAAIAAWKDEASAQYNYTSEPIAMAVEGGRTIITSHLTGNFPGSPIDLRYAFVLEGDAIGSLEIVP